VPTKSINWRALPTKSVQRAKLTKSVRSRESSQGGGCIYIKCSEYLELGRQGL
jgi:hypothetical protein